jgi:Ras-related protein Rab-1A
MQAQPNNNLQEIKLKLLIIGDTSVGKSSILLTYTDNYFPEAHLATIGVEYKVKELLTDKYKIILQIWDTAGQERFRSITKSFFRNTNGILFVYDITDRKTFQSVKDWIKDSEMHDSGFEKILCGNKIDLKDERQVTFNELEEYGMKKKIEVIETSAKSKINIDESFKKLVDLILSKKTEEEIAKEFGVKAPQSQNINLTKSNTQNKKKKCCGK